MHVFCLQKSGKKRKIADENLIFMLSDKRILAAKSQVSDTSTAKLIHFECSITALVREQQTAAPLELQ